MSWVSQIVKSALEGDAVEMKTAFEKEMDERISDKMDDLYQEAADELFAESEELDESFKRGDIIEVPGSGSTKHKAVMIAPNKAVYIEDDSAESVPSDALSKSTKAKRTTRDEKNMASEYLKAMKEDLELDERRGGAPKMGPDPFRSMTAGGEKDRRSAAQKGSKWRVTFKTGHKAVDVTARNTSEAIKKGIASADKQDVQGSPAYKDVKKISEEVEYLDEKIKIGTKVKIHSPGDSYHGKVGRVGEIRHGSFKGAPKTYTIDYEHDGNQSVQLPKNKIKMYTEEVDLDEAKMSDGEVLAAAKKLAKNGKDAKTKSFGQGLVDFYDENDSFTPDQVAGLQNIMKNASFQMAKD